MKQRVVFYTITEEAGGKDTAAELDAMTGFQVKEVISVTAH